MASAEEEEGGGDVDLGGSLFEGMVLFTPSDLASPPPDLSPPPPPVPVSSSQPLDEDLFSDLTLETPGPLPYVPSASSPPPHPSPSRQLSRKKKRVATVRIGYARDAPPDESPSSPHISSPLPLPLPLPLPTSPAQAHSPLDGTSIPISSAERNPPPPLDAHPDLHPPPHTQPSPEPSPEPVPLPSGDERENGAHGEDKDRPQLETEQVPPTVAKEDSFGSIEERLPLVRAQISQNLNRLRKEAAAVSAERKALGRRRRKATGNVSLASAKYMELEQELEEACEAEDFERAERVSESLAAVEKDRDGFLSALKEAEADCDAVDTKMQEVLAQQIEAEEEGVALLEEFAKDAAENADIVFRNAKEISLKEVDEWQLSMESLEIKKLEVEIRSQLINEARSGLQDSIGHLVENDRKEREMLKRKQDILAKELHELLALVKLKEAEIAENDSQIQEVDERISAVVSEFHDTQSSIAMKYDDLQLSLSEIDSESEALYRKKKEIDGFILLAEQKRSKLKELANITADEGRTCQDLVGLRKSLASSVLKSREDKVRLAKMEEKILEDINILKQQISAARNSLQELSSSRAGIQQEIASYKESVSFIDKRGPELEAEKKVAAAARNFKEAGRIAAEAKVLNVEKESLKAKWEKAVSDLEKLEQEIKQTLDSIQENEGLVLSKEKEAATASYESLQLVGSAARAERQAALQLGDNEEADILLQEAEAAECKARELREAYNLNPEEHGNTSDHFVSIAFITSLAGQHLAEMAASLNLSAPLG